MKLYRLLSEADAQMMLAKSAPMTWTPGLARTKALTGTAKQNLEILPAHNKEAATLLEAIGTQVMTHRQIGIDCIPFRCHPPKFSKYGPGAYYQPHTDAPWMQDTRTDISCTIWLSSPADYEGGELCVGDQRFKGQPGEALLYDCGAVHSVAPVTSGERICVVTWVQSRVRDPIKRKLLTDFRKFLSKVEGDPALFTEGSTVFSALLKRWME